MNKSVGNHVERKCAIYKKRKSMHGRQVKFGLKHLSLRRMNDTPIERIKVMDNLMDEIRCVKGVSFSHLYLSV